VHPILHARGTLARYALDVLKGWDCELTPGSVGGALYQTTLHFAMRRLYQPWLGDLTPTFIGVGFHPLLHPVNGYIDRAYLIALRILQNQESEWMRGENGEPLTVPDVLALALNDALLFLQKHLGSDLYKWKWGRLHRAGFHHALGAVKPLDKVFNRGPFPYGGDTSTVWQGAFVPKFPIPEEAVFTASWRQIMDLHDWDNSRGVHPTGQSGHPAGRHYDDQMPLWLQGQHHPLYWSRDKILANQEGILILD
jgi:penicillin amidase